MFRLKQTLINSSKRAAQSTTSLQSISLQQFHYRNEYTAMMTQRSSMVSQFQQRGFALFTQEKASSKMVDASQVSPDAPSSRRRIPQEPSGNQEVIDKYQHMIDQKTLQGRTLAMKIADQVSPDSFIKLQRFDMFLTKMDQLYRNEVNFLRKRDTKLAKMTLAPAYYDTPLKEILKGYNELTTRGFDGDSMAACLKAVVKQFEGRGFRPRTMNDYTTNDMDHSWRMQKIVDDIKFAVSKDTQDYLTGGGLLSAHHLAKISKSLGDLGYKNTELISVQFDKVQHMLNVEQHNKNVQNKEELLVGEHNKYNLETAIYGSYKNFVPRHYVFQGFQTSSEFQEYLDILNDWETDKKQSYVQDRDDAIQENVKPKTEVGSIKEIMNQLIQASMNVKKLQQDQVASIESLRQQYFKMEEATDKHSFLLQNPYIKYDILELQELLVNAGYMNPEEKSQIDSLLSQEPFSNKMDRAAQVFYDYVLNYQPELLSPQYDQFYKASLHVTSQNKKSKDQPQLTMEESQNKMNLENLSHCLIGLSKQCQSYRRDVLKKDYLNKFYEQYLMPMEVNVRDEDFKYKYEHILMEREYLRAWTIFKDRVYTLLPQFISLVNDQSKSKNGVKAMLTAMEALNESKIDQRDLRKKIVESCLNTLGKKVEYIKLNKFSSETAFMGIKALAKGTYQDKETKELGKILIKKIQDVSQFEHLEQIELLWCLCLMGEYENTAVKQILGTLNKLQFDRVDHELQYQDFLKMIDIYNALEFEAPTGIRLTNKQLVMAIKRQDFQKIRYEESKLYDPFKDRVLQGLSKGLTAASITHQLSMENDILYNNRQEMENLTPQKYPYQPDIIMGYQGQKIFTFVLSERDVTSDSYQPDGATAFKMRLLEKAHKGQIKNLVIAVPKVVKYDLQNFKLDFNDEFNLVQEINSQLGSVGGTHQKEMEAAFKELTAVGENIMKDINNFSEDLAITNDTAKLGEFIQMIYKVFHMRHSTDLKYDKIQQEAGYNEVRLALMKLSLMFDNLPSSCSQYIKKHIHNTTLKQILLNIKNTLPTFKDNVQKHSKHNKINQSWIGTRLEVELPVSKEEHLKKAIAPEIINQKFMWVDDYFHYDDWKAKQQSTFDNFSLLVIPHNKDSPKFFYDKANFQRRVPQGIFPFPNQKRQLMTPKSNFFAQQTQTQIGHDEFVLFEKEPYKMMVLNELKKADTLAPLTKEVSFITNLQNIKQSLKSDYSDAEILKIVLNLNFTDDLIAEHLNTPQKDQKRKDNKENYVERDPKSYRDFIAKTYFSKDREDPFTDFYIKEAGKVQRIQHLIDKESEKNIYEKDTRHIEQVDKAVQRNKVVQDLVDQMLLENEFQNEDMLSLSHALKTNVKVNFDIKSLMTSESIYDVDPDLHDADISDVEFLRKQRVRAEAKFIKTKIIFKLYEGTQELTINEKKYLKHWVQDLKENKERNLLNLRDSMIPSQPTIKTISNMDAKSLYALNSLGNVKLESQRHGQFSLNDLVLELSHFLDQEVVDKVEMDIYSQVMSSEWGLGKDFKIVESRNKEIGIVINELEEVFYRTSGMFDDKDLENVTKMLSIKRNKDTFDKQFYDNDMKSLKDFMNDANYYDQRIKMLELWIARKEEEFHNRVVMPPQNMKKTDKELHEIIDKDWKNARESLVSKLLQEDEFGSPITKMYSELSSQDLRVISQNLAVRLYMFNYEYPDFVTQIVKAVIEHQNLLPSDRVHLQTFCKLFELDWRGDVSLKNREEFLHFKPIYLEGDNIKQYSQMNQTDMRQLLKRACSPYVEEVTQKILYYK